MALELAFAVTHCPLFKLSGELRNLIYELSMPDVVYIGANGVTEPGILLTCRIIRREAHDYFYDLPWQVEIAGFHPAAPSMGVKLSRTLKRPHVPIRIFRLSQLPPPNWPNFERWLEAVHAKRATPIRASPAQMCTLVAGLYYYALNTMFRIASSMDHLQWPDVLLVLRFMRPMLILVDSRWGV